MKRSAKAVRIGAELAPLVLILGCLVGSLGLIIAAYQRQAAIDREEEKASVVALMPPTKPELPKPAPVLPEPEPELEIEFEPPEDPTPGLIAPIKDETEQELARAAEATAKLQTLAEARQNAEREVARWKRREQLVRKQAKTFEEQASRLEAEAEALARMRDVLAERRDQEKTELAQAETRARDAFAILPYRGEHGTWRRPIVLECSNGTVKLQPDGPSFGMLELGGLGYRSRSSPILAAVNRAFSQAREDVAPDGGVVVPYVLFVIRPDGIRAYYEARSQLERLGITFGYELVEQDLDIDFPDLNDPAEWPGAPRRPSQAPASTHPSTLADNRLGQPGQSNSQADNPYLWQSEEPPPSARPSGTSSGLSFSDLERELAGEGRLDTGQPGQPALFDGVDLSGPPVAYEPDPRRPSTGRFVGGETGEEPGRSEGVRPGVGLGGSNRSSALSGPGSISLAGRTGGTDPGSGDSRASSTDRPDLPGNGLGLGDFGNRDPSAIGQPADGQGGQTNHPPARPSPGQRAGGSGHLSQPRANPDNQRSSIAGASGLEKLERETDDLSEQHSAQRQGGSRTGSLPDNFSGRLPSIEELAASAPLPIPEGLGSGRSASGPSASNSSTSSQAGQGSGSPSSRGSGSQSPSAPGISLDIPSSSPSTPADGSPTPALLSMGLLPEPSDGSGGDPTKPKTLSLIIDCRPDGVTIQPGGYRISRKALEESDLLVRRLRAIAQSDPNAQQDDASPPWLNFLVQPGGEETFWLCRRQTTFAGLNWPARLRVTESGGLESLQGRLR